MDHSDGAIASALCQGGRGDAKAPCSGPDQGVVMFINGTKVCEIPGTEYHTLPSQALGARFSNVTHLIRLIVCSEVAQMHIFFLDP